MICEKCQQPVESTNSGFTYKRIGNGKVEVTTPSGKKVTALVFTQESLERAKRDR